MVCYGVHLFRGKLVGCGTWVKQDQVKIKLMCKLCTEKRLSLGLDNNEQIKILISNHSTAYLQ